MKTYKTLRRILTFDVPATNPIECKVCEYRWYKNEVSIDDVCPICSDKDIEERDKKLEELLK